MGSLDEGDGSGGGGKWIPLSSILHVDHTGSGER